MKHAKRQSDPTDSRMFTQESSHDLTTANKHRTYMHGRCVKANASNRSKIDQREHIPDGAKDPGPKIQTPGLATQQSLVWLEVSR